MTAERPSDLDASWAMATMVGSTAPPDALSDYLAKASGYLNGLASAGTTIKPDDAQALKWLALVCSCVSDAMVGSDRLSARLSLKRNGRRARFPDARKLSEQRNAIADFVAEFLRQHPERGWRKRAIGAAMERFSVGESTVKSAVRWAEEFDRLAATLDAARKADEAKGAP